MEFGGDQGLTAATEAIVKALSDTLARKPR
jgi:hypothetical protein